MYFDMEYSGAQSCHPQDGSSEKRLYPLGFAYSFVLDSQERPLMHHAILVFRGNLVLWIYSQ